MGIVRIINKYKKVVIMTLGDRLRQLREDRGLDQRDLAEYLSIDRSTYGKYETGKSNPDLEKLSTLAAYFNVTVDWLMGRSKLKNPERDYKETMDFVKDLMVMLNENGHNLTDKMEVLDLIDQAYQIQGILK